MTRRVMTIVCLAIVMASGATIAAEAQCTRIVAIGDLHGWYDGLLTMLRETGIIDERLQWADEGACFVQLGDVVDRGSRSREILDFMMGLQQAAPDRVEMLLGNHEAMNLLGDLRYVAPDEIAAFAAEELPVDRDRGFAAFLQTAAAANLGHDEARAAFDESYPPGWFGHRRAFSAEGRYGKWLLERPVVTRFNDTVFVHGGLSVEDAAKGWRKINREVKTELETFLTLRSRLIDAGWLDPFTPFSSSFGLVEQRYQEAVNGSANTLSPRLLEAAEAYVALAGATCAAADGPLWNRELAKADEPGYSGTVAEILAALGASRIVIAHTTANDRRIQSRFGGRVFAIDTSAGKARSGTPSALEIAAGGGILAVYPDRRETLIEAPPDDAEMERFLLEAEVLEMEEIGTGITRPKKLRLRMGGREGKAAFKDVDIEKSTDLTRFESGAEFSFSDRYHYERAAYLLDRTLGMYMSPVVVVREVRGTKGAVVEWIGNAMSEADRQEKELLPDDPALLVRQRDIMTVFDLLISNSDRNLSNQLITSADWKLHLIDHSRSFRLGSKLPKRLAATTLSLPRPLYDAMLELDEKVLREQMKGLLSRAQIKAMLKRRDKIIEKIDGDREKHSDAMVFHAE